jgi:hypothetical protein
VFATTSSLFTPFHENIYKGVAALRREHATAANMNKNSLFIPKGNMLCNNFLKIGQSKTLSKLIEEFL